MARDVSAAHAGTVRLGDRIVHRMGLGANRITDTDASRSVLRRAVELEVDFIDTSDVYQFNASESTIGATLGRQAPAVMVATKGGIVRTPDGGSVDGSPEYLRQAVQGSLERLQTDCIELYQLHRIDPHVPIEASVGALKEMQSEGLIRRIGVSNVSLEQLERARKVGTIVSVQNRFNLLERDQDPILHYCEQHAITFIPWTPLHRGNLASATTLAEIAADHHATPHQVALQWLLRRSPIMLPIPGTVSVSHLEENLQAADLTLTDDEFRRLSEAPTLPPSPL
jgi:pyridoxine 4-dehydrogenase